MKADGTILIDTKIVDGGMEKGFEMLKDEMSSVGITAKEVGKQIELSFSKMDVSKPIANAVARVQKLEKQLEQTNLDYGAAIEDRNVKSVQKNAAKRISVYDRLEEAREKLSLELAYAVQKEAAAEEKAAQQAMRAAEKKAAAEEKEAQQAIRAAEKEAAAKQRIAEKEFRELTKPARRFGTRFREIVSGALFFNALSSGLRNLTSYFGSAMMANQEYANSLASLRGSLATAFQPIYESILPAIITLINWLNVAAQVIGRFFAAITGKNYSQMQKNAKALNKQAGAIGGVGDAAEEAAKQLAGFDEINRLESVKNASSGGGSAGGGSAPDFEGIEIPSEWEKEIESLALRIKDIFFKWENLTPEDIAQKLITALGVVAGGLIGFALGGPGGALIGMAIGAGIGVAISGIIFDGDGKLSGEELLSALTTALFSIGGGLIGFAVGGPAGAAVGMIIGAGLGVKLSQIMFDGDGKLSSEEIIKALLAGISALAGGIIGFALGGPGGAVLGAVVGLGLGFSIQAIDFDGVENAIKEMLESVRNYFSTTFSDGFLNGVGIMLNDAMDWMSEMFWSFVDSIVREWNSIWSGINQYQTSGTISPQTYSNSPAIASYARTPEIPALARGAVLPANKPFLAMVGDQTNGTNVEAPLETIKQALSEVMAQQGWDVNVEFRGELAALARILAPVITKEQRGATRARGT